MITKSQRSIAYFLLACQLLSSCGGKQEMIIPNTFLNDHQQNCVAKEEYKSPISSIQEAKASAVTNQVHEEVTLRSSSTFFPASQPVCNGRVDARLKMKNTSSTHNRMASKPFTISTWQKVALFSIALNNTFACASRPYAFKKKPKQHHISSEPEELASTASTEQVQPKTVEDDLQIPTSQEQEKHRPVFARAKNAKKYAFVNKTSADQNMSSKQNDLKSTMHMQRDLELETSFHTGSKPLTKLLLGAAAIFASGSKPSMMGGLPVLTHKAGAVTLECSYDVYKANQHASQHVPDSTRNHAFVLRCDVEKSADIPVTLTLSMHQILKAGAEYFISYEADKNCTTSSFEKNITGISDAKNESCRANHTLTSKIVTEKSKIDMADIPPNIPISNINAYPLQVLPHASRYVTNYNTDGSVQFTFSEKMTKTSIFELTDFIGFEAVTSIVPNLVEQLAQAYQAYQHGNPIRLPDDLDKCFSEASPYVELMTAFTEPCYARDTTRLNTHAEYKFNVFIRSVLHTGKTNDVAYSSQAFQWKSTAVAKWDPFDFLKENRSMHAVPIQLSDVASVDEMSLVTNDYFDDAKVKSLVNNPISRLGCLRDFMLHFGQAKGDGHGGCIKEDNVKPNTIYNNMTHRL